MGFVPLILAIIVSAILGFIFILSSRFFLKITKPPNLRESIWVGWAIFWIAFNFFWSEKEMMPKVKPSDRKGYEFRIIKNKIEFVHPPSPKKKLTASWLRRYLKDPYMDDSTIYVHGEQDGENRIFYLSTSPTSIIPADFGEDVGEYVDIFLDGYSPIRKPYKNKVDRRNFTIFTTFFIVMGLLFYIKAQIRAFSKTEVESLEQASQLKLNWPEPS